MSQARALETGRLLLRGNRAPRFFAGTVETLAPPVLSFLWFPVRERATATAIMASANTAGTAVGFLTALVVPASGATSAILDSLTHVYWAYFAVCGEEWGLALAASASRAMFPAPCSADSDCRHRVLP